MKLATLTAAALSLSTLAAPAAEARPWGHGWHGWRGHVVYRGGWYGPRPYGIGWYGPRYGFRPGCGWRWDYYGRRFWRCY